MFLLRSLSITRERNLKYAVVQGPYFAERQVQQRSVPPLMLLGYASPVQSGLCCHCQDLISAWERPLASETYSVPAGASSGADLHQRLAGPGGQMAQLPLPFVCMSLWHVLSQRSQQD